MTEEANRADARSTSGRRRRRCRRGRWRLGVATFAIVVLSWLGGCWFVVVHPKTNRPQRAAAVVVLGSPIENGRLDEARALIADGLADTLVISVPLSLQPHVHVCGDGIEGVRVICFQPSPATTQGEARQIRDLAAQHGWKKIIVVTSTYHVSRARMIVQRCFPGELLMVEANHKIGVTEWMYQFAYQTGGYLKAFLKSGC
jgi:hypothetical protein